LSRVELEAGQVFDRYIVEALIGSGGMASVFRVRHTELDTLHALKVVDSVDAQAAGRLRREGKALGKLAHPNIVGVSDLIDVQGSPALVLELIEGPTLEEVLSKGPVAADLLDDLASQILSAVASAHDGGVVHRDLKPSNVLLRHRPDGGFHAKIADFGLVRALAPSADTLQTAEGLAVGSPAYMAPEQISGAHDVGRQTDLWALGCIFYEMATGVRAFPGTDLMMVLGAVSLGKYDPKPLAHVELRHAAAIRAVLHLEPNNRPADCAAMACIWNGTEGAPPSSVEPPTAAFHAVPAWRGARWLLVSLLLAAVAWWAYEGSQGPDTPEASYVTKSQDAYYEADFDRAAHYAQLALDETPHHPLATLLLVESRHEDWATAQGNAAVEAFVPAPKANDAATSLLLVRKLALTGGDVAVAADDHFERFPDDVFGYIVLAKHHFARNLGMEDYDLARVKRYMELASERSGPDSSPMVIIAVSESLSDDLSTYLLKVQHGLEVFPRNRALLARAGVLALRLENIPLAETYCDDLKRFHSGHVDALTLQLRLAITQGDTPTRDNVTAAFASTGLRSRLTAGLAANHACDVGQLAWADQWFLTTAEVARSEGDLGESATALVDGAYCVIWYRDFDRFQTYINLLSDLAAAPELNAGTKRDVQLQLLRFQASASASRGELEITEQRRDRLRALGESTYTLDLELAVLHQHATAFESPFDDCPGYLQAGFTNKRLGFSQPAITELLAAVAAGEQMSRQRQCPAFASSLLAEIFMSNGEVQKAKHHAHKTIALLPTADEDLPLIVSSRQIIQADVAP
jgi:serine/threonine protein kinase